MENRLTSRILSRPQVPQPSVSWTHRSTASVAWLKILGTEAETRATESSTLVEDWVDKEEDGRRLPPTPPSLPPSFPHSPVPSSPTPLSAADPPLKGTAPAAVRTECARTPPVHTRHQHLWNTEFQSSTSLSSTVQGRWSITPSIKTSI